MNKLLLTILSVITLSLTANAGSGIFGTGVVINNNGTKTLYEATLLGDSRHAPINVTAPTLNSTGFDVVDLGEFDITTSDSLLLLGGEMLTFKNSGSDVSGSSVFYALNGSPTFTELALIFNENDVNGTSGDQRWYAEGSSVDILSLVSTGTHTLDVYFKATSSDGDHIQDNGGSNFRADFTVIPEPSSMIMLGLTGLAAGGLALLKRRNRA